MLPELYQYARQHDLVARVGYKERKVKAYIRFLSKGGTPELVASPWPTTYAPDLGTKAFGTTQCNPFVEKAIYVLNIFDPDNPKDKNNPVKHQFYVDTLLSAAVYEPRFTVCHQELSNADNLAALRELLVANKLGGGDSIGLMVDGVALERSENLYDWWEEFRSGTEDKPKAAMRCLITGKSVTPMATVPKVSGLLSVGGHTSGDALLCFDKDSFTSYGLKQGENACVSEAAMTAVNAALTSLLKEAPRLAGARYVYFYQSPVAKAEDPMPFLLPGFGASRNNDKTDSGDSADAATEEGGESSDTEASEADNAALADAAEVPDAREDAAWLVAKNLLQSIHKGERPELLQNRYYIMPLSGAGGRMMVRGWMEGSFVELCENIQQWFDDLRLVTPGGQSTSRAPTLTAINTRLLKCIKRESPRDLFGRIDKELSGVSPGMLYAIINNTRLQDTVATRALLYIRSSLLASGDDSSANGTMDSLACQILKAWLNRKTRAKGGKPIMEERLNPAYPNIPYHIGRLMAVYAAIQTAALGSDLGAGVLERYYASASSSPKLVIGKLAKLSQHHLSKLSNGGNGGASVYYNKLLQDIYLNVPQQSIPTTLSLLDQSEFALGYYHQRADLFTSKKGSLATAEEAAENEDAPNND